MAKIFVSGANTKVDRAATEHLGMRLRRQQHEVFQAYPTNDDSTWSETVAQQILGCEVFIVLLSAEGCLQQHNIREQTRLAREGFVEKRSPRIIGIRVLYDGEIGAELRSYLKPGRMVAWNKGRDISAILQAIQEALPTAEPMLPDVETIDVTPLPGPVTEQDVSEASESFFFLGSPGGPASLDDPLYVRRAADKQIEDLAAHAGQSLVIRGAQQRGRSSMFLRYVARCREQGKKVALLDLNNLRDVIPKDFPVFLKAFAEEIASDLRLGTDVPDMPRMGRMTKFLETAVLPAAGGSMTLALDNVDLVIHQQYRSDFFSMFRSWHETKKGSDSPKWRSLDLALSISNDPIRLIDDPTRSPFNVFTTVFLNNLTEAECAELNARCPPKIRLDADDVRALYALLGGHPYLTRLAYYWMNANGASFKKLQASAIDLAGPFAEHLRSLSLKIGRDKELLFGVHQILQNKPIPSVLAARFLAGGIAVEGPEGLRLSCELYAKFFRRLFGTKG